MHDAFLISPTEAFLLGIALEEYLRDHHDRRPAEFMDFLETRLAPFVPELVRPKPVGNAPLDLPDDIEWPRFIGAPYGFSASRPGLIYVDTEDGVLACKWDTSRRSFVDQIVSYLGHSVVKSLPEESKNPTDHATLAEKWASPERWIDSRGKAGDDCGEVERRLAHLASHNKCAKLFDVGRVIGGMLADCRRYEGCIYVHLQVGEEEYDLYRPENIVDLWAQKMGDEYASWPADKLRRYQFIEPEWIDRYQFFRRHRKSIGKLLAAAPLRACPKGRAILERELSRCEAAIPADEADPFAPFYLVEVVEDIRTAHQALWLTIGEVLGRYHSADVETLAEDAMSPVPRMYRLRQDSPPEQISGAIAFIERAFNDMTGSGLAPEHVVGLLANSIEALARGLWPREFTGPRPKLTQILDEKTKSTDIRIKRFAWVAMSLHKTYRNVAAHEMGTFRCTWDEARFFYSGIRMLRSLADEIGQQ